MTFLLFCAQNLRVNFLCDANAMIPQLIDSDGRALHKDSETDPNSKITKITNMTFLQNTAALVNKVKNAFFAIFCAKFAKCNNLAKCIWKCK